MWPIRQVLRRRHPRRTRLLLAAVAVLAVSWGILGAATARPASSAAGPAPLAGAASPAGPGDAPLPDVRPETPGNRVPGVLPGVDPMPNRLPTGLPLVPARTKPTANGRTGTLGGGTLEQLVIPGTRSHFAARPGWVYLPAAYFAANRPLLPVLMLIAGQPGAPDDWIRAGHLVTTVNAFAAAHHGLAPIVVVPDALGSQRANPLCLDSRLGNVDTYLNQDVPAAISAHLRVPTDRKRWAVAGFSYGGTCAWQLAVGHPQTWPTFVDMTGEQQPTLGSTAATVTVAFGGSWAAFRAVDPLDVLARARATGTTGRFRLSAGLLTIGTRDRVYGPQQRAVAAACRAGGLAVRLLVLPGSHSWRAAAAALPQALPWLMSRLAPPVPPGAAAGVAVPAHRSR